jgi:hypothetical protein
VIRQIRILGLSILTVFAVGAVTSAAASAHEFFVCQEGGTEKFEEHLCSKTGESGKWSYLPIAAGNGFTGEGKGGVAKLEGTLFTVRVIISCTSDSFTGKVEAAGASKATITFSGCSLSQVVKNVKTALSTCTVPNITTKPLTDTLITGKGLGPEDEFKPETGTIFAEFDITGAGCALKKLANRVEGKQTCSLPEAVVGRVEHELVCSPSGGSLELDKKPASFFGAATVKAVNGSAWGAE